MGSALSRQFKTRASGRTEIWNMYRCDTLLFRLLLRIEHSRRFLLASIKHRRRIRFLLERGRPLSTATCLGFFFFNLSALALPAID